LYLQVNLRSKALAVGIGQLETLTAAKCLPDCCRSSEV
jgi:hypothetical protein